MRSKCRLLVWCVLACVMGACEAPPESPPEAPPASAATLGAALLDGAPQVVVDLNTRPGTNAQPNEPQHFAVIGGTLYFSGLGSGGRELWRSDGTVEGTWLVRDIDPGEDGSAPEQLTAVGNTLYFVADDGRTGPELWKSDGTAEGTVPVKDIHPGQYYSNPVSLTALGNLLLFVANDGVHGPELWVSDGTEAGTRMLRDNHPNYPADPQHLTVVPELGLVFYSANHENWGEELWRTDGTPEGTFMVQDLVPGRGDSAPMHLTAFGGALYFHSQSSAHGRELRRSQGNPWDITLVRDIVPGTGSSNVETLVAAGTTLYASVPGQIGTTLWRSDGTTAGTWPVRAAAWPDAGCTLGSFAASGGRLYFRASDESRFGCELWKSDGTEAGTVVVKDLNPGRAHSLPTSLVDAQGVLYFVAETATQGRELWRSDGTDTGTVVVKDLSPGSANSVLSLLKAAGSRVFFMASFGIRRELWRTDGTNATTQALRFTRRQTDSASPTALVELNGVLHFTANGTASGVEAWRSDGTVAGTQLMMDLQPGANGSAPALRVKAGGRLFYRAHAPDSGPELWTSDGTPEGSRLVKDINPSTAMASFTELWSVGDTVYFNGNDGTVDSELWASDGTPEGTRRVKDVRPGAESSSPRSVVRVGNTVYFVADDGVHGADLWRTDGTEAGTRRVRESVTGNTGFFPSGLMEFGGLLYFAATDAAHGHELWRSDGTEAGTQRVLDLVPGRESSYPSFLTAWNGALYFSTGIRGATVWRTDGTAAGTVKLHEGSDHPIHHDFFGPRFVPVGKHLFFSTADAAHGTELWKTDGTVQGTVMIRDIAPGPQGSRPRRMVATRGRLYFVAGDGSHGQEVWVSDGTEAGTVMVADLAPGAWSSSPSSLTVVGDHLFFTADDGTRGVELWRMALSASSDTTPPTVTCPEPVFAEATSASGTAVAYPLATAVDDFTLNPTLGYSHPRGGTFSLGTTQVTATATDEAGNTAACTFSVTVRDTTPPAFTCPADLIAEAVTAQGAIVEYPPAVVSDAVTPPEALALLYSPMSGHRFPLGSTPVAASATDEAGNTTDCAFTVTVVPRTLALRCDAPAYTEATSPTGAIVHLSPDIVSLTDGSFPYPREVTFTPASGTHFPKGVTDVTANVVDSEGGIGSCAFRAEVRDTTPPAITCESFIGTEATSSEGAVVTVPEPVWYDVASNTVTFTYSPAPGPTFPLGATFRQAIPTDEAGNVGQACTTVVVVQDTTPPAVTCSADLVVEATGPEGAAVSYAPPSATDAVTSAPTLSATHASGSVFPTGITRVTVTATDGAGNAGTCAFNVTVQQPPPPPSITCPADVLTEATGPQGATVTYPAATASDGRAPVVVTYSHDSGAGFPVGDTTVTATARDAEGRTASCAFTVTVRDTTPPSLTCPADLTVVATGGSAEVFYPPVSVSDVVTPASAVTVFFSPLSGSRFSLGTSTVNVTATDVAGNPASCTFTVTVVPRPLVITCPSDQVVEATSPEGAVVHYGPALVSEGSPPYTVTYSQAAGTRFSKGTTSVTASVQDSQGSGGSCTFSVTVRDTTPPELTCPAVLEFEATSSAGAIADVPAPTWVDAGSAAVTFTHAPAPGSTFSLGATPRIATGTDEAGNTRTCTTVVVVKDTTPPAVTCGADLVVEAPAQDGAAVTYAAASATDAVTSAPTLSASHASGSVFPIGITRVTVTATDGAGNAATCGFNITVQALPPPPSITCPANGVAEATGAQGASVSWAPATSSGGRLPVTLSYSHDSGMGFPLGTTAITATARDSDGRDASCTFAVTVSDTTPPAITCPSDVTVTSVSTNGQAVDFPFATAEDGVSAPEVVSSHASGSLFPPGTTPVVMTATDASGNSASCTLQVTVGTRKPVSVETPESASLGFGCSTGTGASAAVGWSLLLLAGLMRRRGAQQR